MKRVQRAAGHPTCPAWKRPAPPPQQHLSPLDFKRLQVLQRRKRSFYDPDDSEPSDTEGNNKNVKAQKSSGAQAPPSYDGLAPLGLGETYFTPDSFERIAAIEKHGSVRKEPSERAPFEDLKKWAKEAGIARPEPARDYFSSRKSVDMYVLSISYSTREQWYKHTHGAIVRMFGVTSEGHSCYMAVEQFWPYFRSNIPPVLERQLEKCNGDAELEGQALEKFREWLDRQMKKRDDKHRPLDDHDYVRSVTIQRKKYRSCYFYQRDHGDYLRIETSLPRYVPLGKDVLSQRHFARKKDTPTPVGWMEEEVADDTANTDRFELPANELDLMDLTELRREELVYVAPGKPVQVYEADVPFVMRFSTDKNISGCGWVSVPMEHVRNRVVMGQYVGGEEDEHTVDLGAQTQLALRVHADQLVSQPSRAEVPFEIRRMSIDIEAACHEDRAFPIPSLDPTICVAANLYRLKEGNKQFASVGFTVGKVNEIKRLSHICSFKADDQWTSQRHSQWSIEGRRDMLLAIKWLITVADPDIIEGYNLPFDMSFLNKQADALSIGSEFRRYGRMRDEICVGKGSTFSSKALGTRDTISFSAEGRIFWDVLDFVVRNDKPERRNLGFVAEQIVGQSKLEMPHEMIGPLWMMSSMATDATRTRVLDYNENDERITARINTKKGYIWQTQEMTRATGVTIETIQYRGAGAKSVSLLLRDGRDSGYIYPTYPDLQTKKTAAGFGVVPEGFLLKLEREVNEQISTLGLDQFTDDILKKLQDKYGVDDLVYSGNDTYIFAHLPPGTEEHNLGLAKEINQWAMSSDVATQRIKNQYEEARKKGGRLVMFFVGKFTPGKADKAGKLYGVAQVTGRPALARGSEGQLWQGGARGAPFTIRWLHAFSHRDALLATVPDAPGTQERCDERIPASSMHAQIILDICRYRRLHPERQMDLFGKPLDTEIPILRKKSKGSKQQEESDDPVDRGPKQFDALLDGWDHEGEEDKDDDADKYEGAVVLQTITGLYNVPISTLDFASLYPSLIILHNLCYTTILTRELIRQYDLKECPKGPDGEYLVDAKGQYLADYTIKESGHIVANPSLREGRLCLVLRKLLALRDIAKGFMNCGNACKAASIALNAKPTDPALWDALDAKIKAFDKAMQDKDPNAISILDRMKDIWARICALKNTGTPEEVIEKTKALRAELLEEVSSLAQLFDARQNALKIAANSLYGFSGARVGKYPMRAIAEVTTSEGRKSINKKRDLVEKVVPLPKRNCYGRTRSDWEKNKLVPEAELARARAETDEEFEKHLKELATDGMRPVVIGGDTDSIFICWPHCLHPNEAHELSEAAAKEVNKRFTLPQKTTYEKTFWPSLYLAQKKYAGRMWEPKDKDKPKQEPKPGGKDGETRDAIHYKGIEVVRRDSNNEVREALQGTLRDLLVENDIAHAAATIAKLVEAHRTQRTDISTLLMSKSLSRKPEDYATPAIHVNLALEMAKRDPATAPKVGDRVHFLVVKPKEEDAKTSTMGEDPQRVIENNLALNTEHYLEKLLRPAVRRILEPLCPGIMARIFDNVPLGHGRLHEAMTLDDNTVIRPDRTKELKDIKEGRLSSDNPASNATLAWAKQMSTVQHGKIEDAIRNAVTEFREEIGHGHVPHTQKLYLDRNWQQLDDREIAIHEEEERERFALQNKPKEDQEASSPAPVAVAPVASRKRMQADMDPFADLLEVRKMCPACNKNQVQDDNQALCKTCNNSGKLARMTAHAKKEKESRQASHDEIWKHCIGCAGTLENAYACGAVDCDNFYRRKIASQNLAISSAWLAKLKGW